MNYPLYGEVADLLWNAHGSIVTLSGLTWVVLVRSVEVIYPIKERVLQLDFRATPETSASSRYWETKRKLKDDWTPSVDYTTYPEFWEQIACNA